MGDAVIAVEPELAFQTPTYYSPQQLVAGGELPPTLGPLVAQWMEAYLVHGEGDSEGNPVRLTPHQRYVLDRIYEYDPKTMRLLHDRVVIGMARGNSKTEDAARIALAELAGPAMPLSSPHVVTSASSYDQADNVFGAAKKAIGGPLKEYFAPYDTELQPLEGGGVIERIAARAGTAEGGLPTCAIGDELHEWRNPGQERVYVVQGKALKKRQVPRRHGISGAFHLSISTAGDDLDSLLGRLYLHGRAVASGELEDPGFLFLWWEAPKLEGEDLDDPEQLERAILAANPAVGHWLSLEQIVSSFHDGMDRHEFERYNLNRWVTRPKAWIAEASWLARAGVETSWPEDRTEVVIGFKGSYNRNTTALVGWTRDDFGFVIKAWERDNRDSTWTVPRKDVDEELHAAMARWQVAELVCDPVGWATEIEGWEAKYGVAGEGGVVLRFEVNVAARMAPAVDRFRGAVLDPRSAFRHDGSPILARHVKNCNAVERPAGTMLATDRPDSPRRIDVALAAVLARQRAMAVPAEGRRPVMLGSLSR